MFGIMNTVPYRLVRRMFWDGPIPTEAEFACLLEGRITEFRGVSRRNVFARMLERWSWEELWAYAGHLLPETLDEETFDLVSIAPIRTKYERLKRFLHGITLSLPGWGAPADEDASDTVFSHRRHGARERISW